MWHSLHGGTADRARVEIARELGQIQEADVKWLLRELGEVQADGPTAQTGPPGNVSIVASKYQPNAPTGSRQSGTPQNPHDPP